jgi:hypothetical protein
MNTRHPRRHRARLAILLTAVIGSFALLWIWFGRSHAAPEPPPAQPAVESEKKAPPPRMVAATATPAPAAPPVAPVVDEVVVEKRSVCEGEDNLVTVRAHTPNGGDAFLHYTIAGSAGSPNPVRLYRQKDGSVPWPSVRVFGKDNVLTSVPVPRYEVRDCGATRTALISHSLRPNTSSEFELFAKIGEHGDLTNRPPFRGVEYRWKFGDGSTATTKVPQVTHSYEHRPQTSLNSDFVVGVEVTSTDGERVSGRTVLDLRNPAFEMLSVGHAVALMSSLDPRLPELDERGVVHQGVRLWHRSPRPVTIGRVRSTRSYADGHTSPPQEVDIGSLLGSSSIPPGDKGIELSTQLDTNLEPDVLVVTYDIEGTSSDGLLVKGGFSVMRPPVPSKTPIADKTMLAKIAAAQSMLHTDVVSLRDLQRLEQEGAFATLTAAESRGSR